MDDNPDRRVEICRSLGIASMRELHRLVMEAAKMGIDRLLRKGLNAQTLTDLGYGAAGMKKLGFTQDELDRLGYGASPKTASPESARPSAPHGAAEGAPETEAETIRRELDRLIAQECRANELHQAGYTVHHCRIAGYDAREVAALGFSVSELAAEYDLPKLRRAGYGVRDLRTLFSGQELRGAGYSATEMRMAGFTVRDLLNFGYTENQVRGAGYSVKELLREGLSKQMVDKSRLHRKSKG
jgi:intracellular multiplication protein IcmE